jgi:hypothetical protein
MKIPLFRGSVYRYGDVLHAVSTTDPYSVRTRCGVWLVKTVAQRMHWTAVDLRAEQVCRDCRA